MFNRLVAGQQKVIRTLGSAKFAVAIILVFAAYLCFGTFMESYHGADYANRLVYKSMPFILLQLLMFLSILVATIERLPLRKRLHGFYVIHLGLIILFLGSFITFYAGIDGSLTLAPNSPSKEVFLTRDQLSIELNSQGKELTLELPYAAKAKELNFSWEENFTITRFIPFAEEQIEWQGSSDNDERQHSGQFSLKNDKFSEELTLSLHPLSDFESTAQLGPLNVHYMPEALASCFSQELHEGLLIWDARQGRCFTPSADAFAPNKKTGSGRLVVIKIDGQDHRFMPDLSPLPVDENLRIEEDSNFRIFGRKLFETRPHLFIFGTFASFYDSSSQRWMVQKLTPDQPISLPWMGFELLLRKHSTQSYPLRVPTEVTPVQDNGQLIKGNLKAVEVRAGGTQFWVTNERPMSIETSQGKLTFRISRQSLILPFEVTLDRFKMDTDPGTNNPASYESFVTLFLGNLGASKHHVFMNQPLKHHNFTLYQASYFQAGDGNYGSVFSVNYDPGRAWKYLGSLLIVLGSLWHFGIRKNTVKGKNLHA